MSKVLIEESYLSDIADAIRSVGDFNGTTFKPSEMDEAILQLTSTENTTEKSAVTLLDEGVEFIDYDGTILYTYSWNEIAQLEELPDLPTNTFTWENGEIPLTCTNWNWSLTSIIAQNQGLLKVGAVYEPTDGNTHFICYFSEHADVCLVLSVNSSDDDGVVYVYWGDDTFDTVTGTGTVKLEHTYDDVVEHREITITAENCTYGFVASGYRGAFYQSCSSAAAYRADVWRRSMLKKAFLGNACTTIGDSAFSYCVGLNTVTIPESVTSVGEQGFYYCNSLETVILPKNIISVEASTFQYAYSLKEAILSENTTSIGEKAFYNCYSLTSITIPDGITTISDSTFYNCYSLTSITIPDGVTTISDGVFYYCCNLRNLSLPDSITTIGSHFLYYGYSATNVVLPSNLSSVGSHMFYHSGAVSIDGVFIDDAASTNCFYYAYCLKNLTNVRYIGQSVNFSYAEELTVDSLNNIIAALCEAEDTLTLTIGSTNLAKLTDDEIAVATEKGWTVA